MGNPGSNNPPRHQEGECPKERHHTGPTQKLPLKSVLFTQYFSGHSYKWLPRIRRNMGVPGALQCSREHRKDDVFLEGDCEVRYGTRDEVSRQERRPAQHRCPAVLEFFELHRFLLLGVLGPLLAGVVERSVRTRLLVLPLLCFGDAARPDDLRPRFRGGLKESVDGVRRSHVVCVEHAEDLCDPRKRIPRDQSTRKRQQMEQRAEPTAALRQISCVQMTR